jgi:ParB family transcriptional regulator, chromosome partitioning protein
MRELKRVPVSSLRPDPGQPRKHFDETQLLALGQNMMRVGQQVPLIVCGNTILDGERRWRAAQLVGMTELDVVMLASRPTTAELRILQLSIDIHDADLSAMERSDFLAQTKHENNWSISELAEKLSMKQPLVTKLLKFQDGCEDVRSALHAGLVDQDKAYTICQEADHAKQRELLKNANDLTREQLRQKARSNGQAVDLKASVARFPLPGGVMVSVQGRKMNLGGAIEAMLDVVKELKKGQADHWDITTAMRVLRHRAQQATK